MPIIALLYLFLFCIFLYRYIIGKIIIAPLHHFFYFLDVLLVLQCWRQQKMSILRHGTRLIILNVRLVIVMLVVTTIDEIIF